LLILPVLRRSPNLRLFDDFLRGEYNVPSGDDSLHTLGVCTMILGEDRFLEEWLLYHRALGVTQFYLYDQAEDTKVLEVLAPYITGGLVTYHSVVNRESLVLRPRTSPAMPNMLLTQASMSLSTESRAFMFQDLLLRKCFDDYGSQVNWLGHFDVDEYVVIKPRPFERDARLQPLADASFSLLGRILEEEPLDAADGVVVTRLNYVNVGRHELDPHASLLGQHLFRRVIPTESNGGDSESILAYRWSKSFAHTRFSSSSIAITDSHRVHPRNATKGTQVYVDFTGVALNVTDQGGYEGQMEPNFARVYLHHYMQRDKIDCFAKADRRIACCPDSWRAKLGRAWCEDASFNVQEGAWNAPGQRWILDTLDYDPSGAQSYVALQIAATIPLLPSWDSLSSQQQAAMLSAAQEDQEHFKVIE
jgi:hypothetical protein